MEDWKIKPGKICLPVGIDERWLEQRIAETMHAFRMRRWYDLWAAGHSDTRHVNLDSAGNYWI